VEGSAVVNSFSDVELGVKVASTFASTTTTFTINVVGVDANVDAWNSVNMHRFDVWCFFESSRTFGPAVGLGTSISGVEVPPPELRKVAHIPPTMCLCVGL
jgi:hypothetical protein